MCEQAYDLSNHIMVYLCSKIKNHISNHKSFCSPSIECSIEKFTIILIHHNLHVGQSEGNAELWCQMIKSLWLLWTV